MRDHLPDPANVLAKGGETVAEGLRHHLPAGPGCYHVERKEQALIMHDILCNPGDVLQPFATRQSAFPRFWSRIIFGKKRLCFPPYRIAHSGGEVPGMHSQLVRGHL